MKSIVEEASSIKQAIENGWKRLGEPTVFSVKILERPETGFLGFNTKSAKIALIVEEKSAPSQIRQQFRDEQSKHKNAPVKKAPHSAPIKTSEQTRDNSRDNSRDYSKDKARDNGRDHNSEESVAKWSDDRCALVRTWLKELLHLMKKDDVTFDMHVTDATLHIKFNAPFLHDSKQERFVFASISHLMMETLRNKSKKILRNMRINITGQ